MKTQMLAKCFIGAAILFVLSGCGKTEQDPLSGKDSSVTDGTKDKKEEKPVDPTPSELIRIDTVQFYSFEVGKTDEFKIASRVMAPDYNLEVMIDNLSDFPGAKFDPATGIFKWTPAADTVTAPNLFTEMNLKVRVIAENKKMPDMAVQTRSQQIPIRVNVKIQSPEIVSATPTGASVIRENSSSNYLTIVVVDPMSNASSSSWPKLTFFNKQGGNPSLAAYASVINASRDLSTGKISYQVGINVYGIELTNQTKYFDLAVVASNEYGQISTEKIVTYTVKNQLDSVQSTWANTYVVKPGTQYNYTFIYYNKKNEGTVQQPVFTGVPTGATISCLGGGSVQTCKLEWNVPATESPATYYIKSTVDTWESSWSSADKVTANFTHALQVSTTPVPFGGQ